ncbi:TPA: metallophosphoesterase [Providencia rettgeri]|nr:metallophosphoesterase [Providencia rettgeri]
MKSILHISDLHLSISKNYGFHDEQAKVVVEKIIADTIQLKSTNNINIDTVFFTGDMTFSGQPDEFSSFNDNFLQPLIDGLGITINDIYVVPGNHDMNRKAIKSHEKPLRNIYGEEHLSTMFSDIDNGEYEWARAKGYSDFSKNYLNNKNLKHDGTLCRVYEISSKLYIMCINSSWLAQDDDDYSKLRITDRQLKILDRVKIPQNAKIIALVHHPLDWLSIADRNNFSSFIEKKVSILCYGHMHDFQQKQESSFSEGITVFLQAGTLDVRENHTGYSIIQFNSSNNTEDGRVLYRKYDIKNEIFVPWVERGNNGEFNYSTNSMVSFDVSKFSLLSLDILEKEDTDLLINTGLEKNKKKSLRALFTEPNYIEDDTLSVNCVKINKTKDIIASNYNLIVFGAHSSGKTSLLKYMYIKGLEKQAYKEVGLLHFYIDALTEDFSNKYKVMKSLCASYFSAELSTNFEDKIKSAINAGNCIIYIDNIDFLFEKKASGLVDFIKEYKECRYVIACDKIASKDIISNFIVPVNIDFKATTIGTLRRCNVRDIVSRWELAIENLGENKLYNEITKTINNSQLPHNYFIYSMLLAIFEVDNDVKGILSESDIIENFIEILLKKHILATPSNKPQYKELLHFLGFFGKYCFENKKTSCDHNELLEVALTFNKNTLSNYNVPDYIDPLLQSGILSKNKFQIQFSQPSFMYYAISYFMKHDVTLRDSVLHENNYLLLDKVVEYYASQNASSLDLLNILGERTSVIIKDIQETIKEKKNIDINNTDLNHIKGVSVLDIISSREDFENYIESLNSNKVRDDNRLDEIAPLSTHDKECVVSNSDNDREGEANDKKNVGPRALLENLSLYARVFRNTELTMDPKKTIDIFDDIVNGYMFYMKSFILMMDESYVIPYIVPKIEKKMAEDNISEEEKDKIIDLFKLILSLVKSAMPNTIQMIMTDVISSKKPRIENIIRATRDKEGSDILKGAILGYILMDIRDENITPIISEIAKIKNNLVQESLFLKINNVILSNYDLPRKDIESLKETLNKIARDKKIRNMPKLSEAISAINDDGIIE